MLKILNKNCFITILVSFKQGIFNKDMEYDPKIFSVPDSDYLDLEVKLSNIPNSGNGLFAKKTFEKGEIISEYKGPIIGTKSNEDSMYDNETKMVEINENYTILGRCIAAYANDCVDYREGVSKKDYDKWVINREFPKIKGCNYNAKFKMKENKAFLVAKEQITPGEEIFLSYGFAYWNFFFKKTMK